MSKTKRTKYCILAALLVMFVTLLLLTQGVHHAYLLATEMIVEGGMKVGMEQFFGDD